MIFFSLYTLADSSHYEIIDNISEVTITYKKLFTITKFIFSFIQQKYLSFYDVQGTSLATGLNGQEIPALMMEYLLLGLGKILCVERKSI